MSNMLVDTKIAQSPHHAVYSKWLQNGMSNRACERKAKELFDEDISYEAFRRYRSNMSPDEIVPTYLPQLDKDLDIDEKHHLQAAILIVEQRLVKAQELEDKMNGLVLDKVDKLMEHLTRMLMQLANMRNQGVRVKTIVNQQFNKFSANRTNDTDVIIESDDEFKQRIVGILTKTNEQKHELVNTPDELDTWFNGIIQEAKDKAKKAQQTENTSSPDINPQV